MIGGVVPWKPGKPTSPYDKFYNEQDNGKSPASPKTDWNNNLKFSGGTPPDQTADKVAKKTADKVASNSDIWKRDKDGGLVKRNFGRPKMHEKREGSRTIEVEFRTLEIQAKNGKWYDVLELTDTRTEYSCYSSNCHATSLGLSGEIWVEPEQFEPMLSAFFTRSKTSDTALGNLVVFTGTNYEPEYDHNFGREISKPVDRFIHSGIIDSQGKSLQESTWGGEDGGRKNLHGRSIGEYEKKNTAKASTWIRK